MAIKPLNIFYKEPDEDRWMPYDRHVRKIIRRIFRGRRRPGGQEMVAINLLKGLDKLKIPYHFNNFRYIKNHPSELACIVGKPHLLFERKWENPIMLGASVFSHPYHYQNLLVKYPTVQKILVPGEWMKQMFDPYYPDKVISWPVGIDTDEWTSGLKKESNFDFLIYDKVRWKYDYYEKELITPIKQTLQLLGHSFKTIRYMHYTPEELKQQIGSCKWCIFLCEHETQGLAYQQILATGTPILAWDRGGHWEDPDLYPDKVKFQPVTSVPYWDEELCGRTFASADDFEDNLKAFIQNAKNGTFNPRKYILDNLTLEKCAEHYTNIANQISSSIK